jgi:hypothetical protein
VGDSCYAGENDYAAKCWVVESTTPQPEEESPHGPNQVKDDQSENEPDLLDEVGRIGQGRIGQVGEFKKP